MLLFIFRTYFITLSSVKIFTTYIWDLLTLDSPSYVQLSILKQGKENLELLNHIQRLMMKYQWDEVMLRFHFLDIRFSLLGNSTPHGYPEIKSWVSALTV